MEKTGPIEKGKPPVLFCLDEFAALGHMESIEKAAGQVASFGVKLWPVIQDLTQLQRDYEKAWETFMGNAGLLTFLGNTDLTSREHIAKRLGDTEVIRTALQASESWQKTGGGSGPDVLTAMIGQGRGSVSDSASRGGNRTLAQQIVRGPLLNPNEVIQAFARDAGNILVMASSKKIPPVALWRCEYHSGKDDGLFGGLFDPAPGQDPPQTSAAEREKRDRLRGP